MALSWVIFIGHDEKMFYHENTCAMICMMRFSTYLIASAGPIGKINYFWRQGAVSIAYFNQVAQFIADVEKKTSLPCVIGKRPLVNPIAGICAP